MHNSIHLSKEKQEKFKIRRGDGFCLWAPVHIFLGQIDTSEKKNKCLNTTTMEFIGGRVHMIINIEQQLSIASAVVCLHFAEWAIIQFSFHLNVNMGSMMCVCVLNDAECCELFYLQCNTTRSIHHFVRMTGPTRTKRVSQHHKCVMIARCVCVCVSVRAAVGRGISCVDYRSISK